MILRRLLLIIIFITLSSCASVSNQEDIIGIYQVSSRECTGNQFQIDSCNDIQLLEFVKGKFYKIRDNENAFVVWSGNKDLTYNVRKIKQSFATTSFPFNLTLENDITYVERIIFNSNIDGLYEFGDPSSPSILRFHRALPEQLSKYIKNYPGND